VPDEGARRYETIIATFVGVCALLVSAYTAYIQKQQVRAQVLPILEYSTSNEPFIRFTIANKGVGPALVRHVVVKAEGKPATRWRDVLIALAGPGKFGFWQSTFAGRTVSPGESVDVMVPWGQSGPLKLADHDPLYEKLNQSRSKVSVEVCYCSTLGDCWTLKAGNADSDETFETRHCPAKSDSTFLQ
jgi:hypothetical protein